MSSLIFFLDKSQVLVATDTLAVTLDGKPHLFCNKAIYLPHIKTIIAGTGMGGFATEWVGIINDNIRTSGVKNLDIHTTEQLLELYNSKDIPNNLTTTVYHFGISEDNQEVLGFAYRSTNGFKSEKLEYGLGVKPEYNYALPTGDYNLINQLPHIMENQIELQNKKLQSERIYIGGEIIIVHLNKSGCNIQKIHEFKDYQKQLKDILTNT